MSNMSLVQKRKIKGMTLLEVIIVLGIMGVIAAGVVVLAQRAIDSQNITKLTQALNTLQTAMVQSFRGKKSYPDTSVEGASTQLQTALVSMGRASSSDFLNPFSGESLVITAVAANNVDNKGFLIKVGGLTQPQCQAIVAGATDLFAYVEVTSAGETAEDDLFVDADAGADSGLGVLKSPSGTGIQIDMTNLTHISKLCGSDGGTNGSYDVHFGSR